MGMTMTEKILAKASGAGKVSPGDLVVTDVDTSVLIDNAFFPAYWREILKVHDPDKVIVVFDHRAPASDLVSAGAHVVGRKFVKQFDIKRFHDVGAHVGISHVVVADRAYALPGTVLVCADFAHLQRRRLQLRGARRGRARHDLRRHNRQGLVPRR